MTTPYRAVLITTALCHTQAVFLLQQGLDPNFPLFIREENCMDEFT